MHSEEKKKNTQKEGDTDIQAELPAKRQKYKTQRKPKMKIYPKKSAQLHITTKKK